MNHFVKHYLCCQIDNEHSFAPCITVFCLSPGSFILKPEPPTHKGGNHKTCVKVRQLCILVVSHYFNIFTAYLYKKKYSNSFCFNQSADHVCYSMGLNWYPPQVAKAHKEQVRAYVHADQIWQRDFTRLMHHGICLLQIH